ncbi:MAG: DUF885 family protein [Terricaulis sp.]
MATLTADPRYTYPSTDEGRAQLLADIRARVARVMELAPRWFGALPRARLEVRRVPQFAEAGSSAPIIPRPRSMGARPASISSISATFQR